MKSKLLFTILSISVLVSLVALPFNYQDYPELGANVFAFYEDSGNFFLENLEECFESLGRLLSASTVFYATLPPDVVFAYIRFGEVLIKSTDKSIEGLAGVGNLFLSGTEQVFFK